MIVSRRAGAASAAVTAATMLTNGLAYLVPVVGARRLSAADLSALATVLALAAIATVPGLGLQIAVAVHRARYGGVPATRLTLGTAAVTGSAVLVAAPLLAASLRLSPGLIGLLAAMSVTVVLGCRWLGETQGDQRFLRLAAGLTVFALGRYAGVAVGLALGAGLVGSLVAGTLTGILALPVLARLAAPERSAAAEPSASPERATSTAGRAAGSDESAPAGGQVLDGRRVATASSATLAMLVLSYADLILARQLLPAAESGAYAVGSVLTKGAIWAPQVVTVLVLPRLARGDRRARTVAVALVAACGVVLVAGTAVASDLAVRLAGGPGYPTLAGYAPLFTAAGALYAVVFVLTNARVAAGVRLPAAPLWIATAVLVVVTRFVAPHTLGGILTCAVATAAATTLALAWLGRRRTPDGPTSTSGRRAGGPAVPDRV